MKKPATAYNPSTAPPGEERQREGLEALPQGSQAADTREIYLRVEGEAQH